jgi:anti-anti-sigma regulatory factor
MCVNTRVQAAVAPDVGFRLESLGGARWRLSGVVDLRAAEAFPAALRAAAKAGGGRMWLECSGLRFIDVAGIRTLAQVIAEVETSVCFQGAGDSLRRYWKLLGAESAFSKVVFDA